MPYTIAPPTSAPSSVRSAPGNPLGESAARAAPPLSRPSSTSSTLAAIIMPAATQFAYEAQLFQSTLGSTRNGSAPKPVDSAVSQPQKNTWRASIARFSAARVGQHPHVIATRATTHGYVCRAIARPHAMMLL